MTSQYHKQLYRHEPEKDIFGDCYRTCIANVFGLNPWEVPHFMVSLDPDFGEAKWVEDQGRQIICFYCSGTREYALAALASLAPGEVFIFSGKSRNGVNHAVLASGGEIIHDPSRDDSGIIGPLTGSESYMGEFILFEPTAQMRNIIGAQESKE